MEQTFRLSLSKETVIALIELEPDVQKKIANKAIKQANTIIEQQYKYYLPKKTGALQRSIGTKVVKYQDGQFTVGIVGTDMAYMELAKPKRSERPRIIRPAKYIHLLEGGTVNRTTKKGQNRGRVTPRPFMHEIQQNVINNIRDILENEVKSAIKRM